MIDRRTCAICFFKLATRFDRGSLHIKKKLDKNSNQILYRGFDILSIVQVKLLDDLQMYDRDLNNVNS